MFGLFQSPRSGQICSNDFELDNTDDDDVELFQSPRSGQICSNKFFDLLPDFELEFQSPRSGQICSNLISSGAIQKLLPKRFNPLDRVKFVQILIHWRR